MTIKIYKNQRLYKKYPKGQINNMVHIAEIYLDIIKKNKLKVYDIPKTADNKLLANLRLNGFNLQSY